ncbi:MAG: ABC transporter ATP-binding protein [Crocinitomicaceae bacterium]
MDELSLTRGLYALVGRNGTGKSTFLNAILGEVIPQKGEITLDGRKVNEITTAELAKKISVVRSRSQLFGDHKVQDVLLLGRLPYQRILAKPSREDLKIVEKVVKDLELEVLIQRTYNILSDGEKQLVMVGRAMVQDTPLILLDEPAAFLDLVNRTELIKHLHQLSQENDKLIIFSTHHIEIIDRYCDGLLLIDQNKLKCIEEQTFFMNEIKQAFGLNIG